MTDRPYRTVQMYRSAPPIAFEILGTNLKLGSDLTLPDSNLRTYTLKETVLSFELSGPSVFSQFNYSLIQQYTHVATKDINNL